jgi:putative spermidine/putrescine transport system substrate-binding protein
MEHHLKKRALGMFAVALCLTTTACGSNDEVGETGGSLTIAGFGGAYGEAEQDAFYTPYERATDAKLEVLSTEASLAAVSLQVENRNVLWDVVELAGPDMIIGCESGILEKIDYTIVNKDGLEVGASGECGIAASIYTEGIGYNSEDFATPPTWRDFFDVEKYPGQRTIESYIQDGTLEYALLGDGVAKEDLYPLDLSRALSMII